MESPQSLSQSALHAGPDEDDGVQGELVYLAKGERTWKTREVGAPKGPRM